MPESTKTESDLTDREALLRTYPLHLATYRRLASDLRTATARINYPSTLDDTCSLERKLHVVEATRLHHMIQGYIAELERVAADINKILDL